MPSCREATIPLVFASLLNLLRAVPLPDPGLRRSLLGTSRPAKLLARAPGYPGPGFEGLQRTLLRGWLVLDDAAFRCEPPGEVPRA